MTGTAKRGVKLPTHDYKTMRSVEINLALANCITKVMKSRDLTFRQVVEWGLSEFLYRTDPASAETLGIQTVRIK